MPVSPSIGFWAVLSILIVFTVLAASVIAAVLLHSKRMRESERRFRLLFDSVFDAILLLDENRGIVDANQSFCNLVGYEKKELLARPLDDLVVRERWPALREEFGRNLTSGIGFLGETVLVDKSGKVVYAELGGKGIRLNGSTYLLASFRDIGRRIEAENALRKKNTAMSELLTHLEEEKMKYRLQIARLIEETIMPIVNRLANPDGSLSVAQCEALKKGLKDLAISSGGMVYALGKLTPREVEICNLLKSGKSTKGVAETLNISKMTVDKYRQNIRRKLVITSKEVNLASFLKNSR